MKPIQSEIVLKVSISFGFFQGLLFVIGIVSLKFVSGEITTYNHLIAGVILIILQVSEC